MAIQTLFASKVNDNLSRCETEAITVLVSRYGYSKMLQALASIASVEAKENPTWRKKALANKLDGYAIRIGLCE